MRSADISRAEDELHSRLAFAAGPEDKRAGNPCDRLAQQHPTGQIVADRRHNSFDGESSNYLFDKAAADFSAVAARLLSSARGERVTVKTS